MSVLYIHHIYIHVLFPWKQDNFINSLQKGRNFLIAAQVTWEASSQKSIMSLYWGKNGHLLCNKISALQKTP